MDHSLFGIVLDFKTALYIAMASDHLPHRPNDRLWGHLEGTVAEEVAPVRVALVEPLMSEEVFHDGRAVLLVFPALLEF